MKSEVSRLKFGALALVAMGLAVAGWLWLRPGALDTTRSGVKIDNQQPAPRVLRWVDRTGTTVEEVGAAGSHENVALAPRSNRIAETRLAGSTANIWLFDLQAKTSSQFTSDPDVDDNAVWSPDESQMAFSSVRKEDVRDLYLKSVDGSGQEQLLLRTAGSKYPTDWSRDGRYLLYTEIGGGGADIWVLPITDRKPIRFLTTLFSESRARFSPDGQWVAYTSNEVGPEEVFVQSFPYGRGKWRVSWTGGGEPHWRGDGRELFYINVGAVWAVDVESSRSAGLAFGYPHKLFDVPTLRAGTLVTRLNVAPDGQRFLLTLDNAN